MPRKKIAIEVDRAIITDWKTGGYTTRQLGEKYGVSNAYVHKVTREVVQENEEVVNAGVAFKKALMGKSASDVNAIISIVNKRIEAMEFFERAHMRVAETVDSKVQMDGTEASYLDLNNAANALLKAKEGVLGKEKETVINNVNQNAIVDVTRDKIRDVINGLSTAV